MLMAGKHVTQPGDPLQPLTVERMFRGLTNAGGPMAPLVQQLRALKTMNPDAYRKAKPQLPYVVCGQFSPAVRRKENFAFTEHFIVDIDKLSLKELDPEAVKRLLKQDESVALLFTSPGNDGVKVLFNFKERIHDAGYYSLFYKRFTARFATRHRLEGLVDLVTSDVSRCCFMSYDPDAWYNPNAAPVDHTAFLDPDSLDHLGDALTEIKVAAENAAKAITDLPLALPKEGAHTLPDEVLLQIKQKLNPSLAARVPKAKEYIQPSELDEVMPGITKALADLDMPVMEARPISYGKQIKVKAGIHWAEVNLFYGKGSYKVVETTKTGSNKQLAEMAAQAIRLQLDIPS